MRFKLIPVVLSLMLAASGPSLANTASTDYTDLWWNPNESGWGVTLTNQGDTIFATIFVFAADGSAHWYSGAAFSTGASVYVGNLVEGRGPYFGGAFNPNLVTNRRVGSLTLDLTQGDAGVISYAVDGVAVTKSIQRQTFRTNNLSGQYIGGSNYIRNGCGTATTGFENSAMFQITHNGSSISIAGALANGLNCTYAGSYSQAGRMGEILGTLSCNGTSTGFRAYEVEASRQGFTARYNADFGGGCTEAGWIGGIKRFQQ
jgi:hypothetical protein